MTGGAIARRLRDERGQALVLAVAIVTIGMLLGLAAVALALRANTQSVHDERNRAAQQAADSGVQQQLYLQSSSDQTQYNFTGGILNTGGLLDCVLPPFPLALATLGYVNSTGSCVPPQGSGASANPVWTPVDNEDYYESEFFETQEKQTTSSVTTEGGNANAGPADYVEFPEILSVGCHTTNLASSALSTTPGSGSCPTGATTNQYTRQLGLLAPTAPLNAIEATNDATVYGSSTLLTNLVNSVAPGLISTAACNATLVGLSCSVLNGTLAETSTLCAGVLNGTNLLLGTILGLVKQLTGGTVSLTTSQLTAECTTVKNENLLAGIGVVDGNISAGHDLYLPANVAALDPASTGTNGGLTGLAGQLNTVLTSVTNVLGNLSSVESTFEFGAGAHGDGSGTNATGDVCSDAAVAAPGVTPSPASGDTNQNCFPQSNSGLPVTAVGAGFVQANGGVCTAGSPSADCTLERPTFGINTPAPAVLPSGIVASGAVSDVHYESGVIWVTGDTAVAPVTLTFTPGKSYTLCGLYADQNVTLQSLQTASGAVQIFIRPPGNGCPNASSNPSASSPPPGGNVVACNGFNNGDAGVTGAVPVGLTAGITSTANPSAVQIYDAGDTQDAASVNLSQTPDVGTTWTDTPISSCPYSGGGSSSPSYTATTNADPQTQVYLGSTSTADTQAYIIYAPQSEVTVNTAAIFAGSLIGWNIEVNALAVLQDLNLGNYAIASVANAYQVAQTVSCNTSVEKLTNTGPTYSVSGGNPTSLGDTSGC